RQQLRDEVQQLLAQAEAVDAAEDAEYGPDRRGDELPAELQRRESRLKRIREATRALKARAKEDAAAKGQPVESAKPDPTPQSKTRPSTRTSRHESRNMASGRGPVRAVRCPRPPRSSTACPASCTRKPARPCMPRARGSSNR